MATREKKSKRPHLRLRLAFLCTGSFIINILPLVLLFVFKWDEYTEKPADTVKLCLGGAMLAVFVLLAVLGKFKLPRKIVSLSIILVMAYLLSAVLNDLMLIVAMALLGECLDLLLFKGAIKKTRENILIGRTADATASQVEEVIKKYVGRV